MYGECVDGCSGGGGDESENAPVDGNEPYGLDGGGGGGELADEGYEIG